MNKETNENEQVLKLLEKKFISKDYRIILNYILVNIGVLERTVDELVFTIKKLVFTENIDKSYKDYRKEYFIRRSETIENEFIEAFNELSREVQEFFELKDMLEGNGIVKFRANNREDNEKN